MTATLDLEQDFLTINRNECERLICFFLFKDTVVLQEDFFQFGKVINTFQAFY